MAAVIDHCGGLTFEEAVALAVMRALGASQSKGRYLPFSKLSALNELVREELRSLPADSESRAASARRISNWMLDNTVRPLAQPEERLH